MVQQYVIWILEPDTQRKRLVLTHFKIAKLKSLTDIRQKKINMYF